MRTEASTTATPPAPGGIAIARQPIHDRARRVVGYELLFRGNGTSDELDEERAGTSVIVETFTGLGVAAIAGERPAHVRVSRRFLLELHAFALPAGKVVLEVAAPAPDDAPLRTVLERLAAQGYRLSFACGRELPDLQRLAPLADSVKLDVTGLSDAQIAVAAARLRPLGAALIAAGVDTPALLTQCHAAGFELFQGFFFCTPDVVEARALPTGRIADLRTLAGLYAQDTTFEEFEAIVARDVGLSYRLLRYLNSAFFGLRREVVSVREALTLLGMRSVRRWATLMALSGTEDRPHELTVTALQRGRFCELIGRAQERGTSSAGADDALFTVGLFSVVDAILGVPLGQALEALPLADAARVALLEHRGPLGAMLSAVLAYERGAFAQAEALAPGADLGALYVAATSWADSASASLVRATTDTSASTTSGAN
jgi:EAL and modified HD-GYP domain-containing signal transduction protein